MIGMVLERIFIDTLFYAKYYAVSLIIAKSRLTTTENQCCYEVNFSLTMPRLGHLQTKDSSCQTKINIETTIPLIRLKHALVFL